MTGKVFALVCLVVVVASCFNSVAAKMFKPDNFVFNAEGSSGFCAISSISRCMSHDKKRSVSDDIDKDCMDECLPSKTSAFDCDKDGKISYREYAVGLVLDEYNQTIRYSFEAGDKNGDGYWSADELRNHPAAKERSDCLKRQLRQRKVLPNQLPGNFDVYDTDKNGLIDWAEFVEQLIKVEKGCTPLKMYRQVMEKIARCDGKVDREDFNMAVAVATPWLFQLGDGEDGDEQKRLMTKEAEEAETEADSEDETEPVEGDERLGGDGVAATPPITTTVSVTKSQEN